MSDQTDWITYVLAGGGAVATVLIATAAIKSMPKSRTQAEDDYHLYLAVERGRNDRRLGESQNPFRDERLRSAWQSGWNQG